MRKKILLALMTILLFQNTNAQAPTAIWQKCYGGSNDETLSGLPIATSDGGFILLSRTNSNNGIVTGNHGGENDAWIIKTNNVGTVQWQRCYGGSGNDEISSIIPTADGGYLLAGYTDSNDGDVTGNHSLLNDAWIVKIDAVGTILWQKCLGGDDNEYLSTIISTSDGGYIACGHADSINNGDVIGNTNSGGWVIKINSLGVIQWQKVYSNDCKVIQSILQTADGGYVLCGDLENSSLANYNDDVIIIKVNQGGNIQWQNSYGGSNNDRGLNVNLTNDGGYMITAISDSNDGDVYGNHGNFDIWVFKISATGVILGQNCYGGSGDEYGATQQTIDGGYLIFGWSTSNDGNITGNNGGGDVFAIKFSATNIIQWQKCYGGTGDEFGLLLQLADGTYFAAGRTNSNYGDAFANLTNATSDMFLIKLTAANLATESFNTEIISIYPNPAKDFVTIDSGNLANVSGWTIKIVNTLGQEVFSAAMNTQQYVVPLNSWSGQGVYFVKIYDASNNLLNTKKIILQ